MIVITGAAGFIASALVSYLNNNNYKNIVIVDDFSKESKKRNWINKSFIQKVDRNNLKEWLLNNKNNIEFIFHLGARTDTTEFNKNIFDKLNVEYSKMIWNFCTELKIPLVYASSAATYGMGELGYLDNHEIIPDLKPLNPYGESKNEFDKWVILQSKKPPFWAGLKFFNVYGPNEYHKERMASVVFHGFNQIKTNKKIKLFRSHNKDYQDGMQLRDFIYVKDIASVCKYLLEERKISGIFNLGTGKAQSFYDLATYTFTSQNIEPNIEFIDTPIDIRDKYQYFTEANMEKLFKAGYKKEFLSLKDGVYDYVNNYLLKDEIY